jgi:hypothetical protein
MKKSRSDLVDGNAVIQSAQSNEEVARSHTCCPLMKKSRSDLVDGNAVIQSAQSNEEADNCREAVWILL